MCFWVSNPTASDNRRATRGRCLCGPIRTQNSLLGFFQTRDAELLRAAVASAHTSWYSNYSSSYIHLLLTFHAVKPFTAIILSDYIFWPNVFLLTTSCNGASQPKNFTFVVLPPGVIMNRRLSLRTLLMMTGPACRSTINIHWVGSSF